MITGSTVLGSVDENARRRFEADWRVGQPKAIEEYLPGAEHCDYRATLEELVQIELEFVWKSWKQSESDAPTGQTGAPATPARRPALVEAYLARFPCLNESSVVLRLLKQEYLVRHGHGDRPPAREYRERFPALVQTEREVEDWVQGSGAPREMLPLVQGYEILGELGRGGMGVVYKARQISLDRIVALKHILAGAGASPEDLARFRTEAEAVARLPHPNIVQIHEVGQQDDRPYFALEFVEGGTLARKLASTPQPARQAAQVVETLARAMHSVHQRGILHRDLKPANVLLTTDGTPKISDFGLAKRLPGEAGGSAPPGQTQSGAIVGTPSYMAPEQAGGKSKAVGPAADVYALGAILYEMLTGRPPFRAETPMETVLQVLTDDPVPPRRLQPKVSRDLETICLKCLDKAPGKRYATAEDLANDLHRYLLGEPIQARPAGLWERTLKWVKRHPAWAALSVLSVVAAASLLTVGGLWYHAELQTAEERERQQTQEAAYQRERAWVAEEYGQSLRRSLYTAEVTLGQQVWQSGNVERVLELLGRHWPQPGQEDLRGFEWYYLWKLCHSDLHTLYGHANKVEAVAYSPKGQTLATASGDHTVKLWNTSTGQERITLKGHKDAVLAVAFSPDGQTLATGGWDKTVKLWETETGRELATLTGHTLEIQSVAFSPDGTRLATGAGARSLQVKEAGECILWDVALRRKKATLPRRQVGVVAVAFHPTSNLLATGSWDKTVKLWSTVTGQMVANFDWFGSQVMAVAFSPDGKKMAVGFINGEVARAELDTTQSPIKGRGLPSVAAHAVALTSLAFSPDSKLLATVSRDRTVKLWDAANGKLVATLWGHLDHIRSVAFAPDGKALATAAYDRTAKIWETPRALGPLIPQVAIGINTLALAPDGKTLATPAADDLVKLWDSASGQELASFPARQLRFTQTVGSSLRFSSDGKWLAAGGREGTIKLWNVATGKELAAFQGPADGGVDSVTFSSDNKLLAAASSNSEVILWDVGTRQKGAVCRGHTFPVCGMAFAPDGKLLATASLDQTVKLWDVATAQERFTLRDHSSGVVRVTFSADGRFLATGSNDEAAKVWEVAALERPRATLKGHAGGVYSLAFVPDGKRLAVGAGDGTVKVWDLKTWEELAVLKGHATGVTAAVFSTDGKTLVTASKDTTVKRWRAATEEEVVARGKLAASAK
jgi:WD40 repeat protein